MKIFTLISFLFFGSTLIAQDQTEIEVDSLISLAKEQLGVSYKYGTSNPGVSFDCSGFVNYVYQSFDLPSSRSSKAYANLGKRVKLEECKKGDCIIFSGTQAGSKSVGHVGIVVENNENGIKFIHSSSSKNHYGVTITDFYTTNYPKRFLQVRRMF